MIPVADAIDFLSQAAPRPWVKRMLHAMLLNAELEPYFLSGRIRSDVSVAQVLGQIDGMGLVDHSAERDAAVRSEIGNHIADLIHGKAWTDTFVEYDEPIEAIEGYVFAGLGYVHYGEIDWNTGDMICIYLPDKKERPPHLFDNIYPELGTEYDRNDFTLEFRGMHLMLEKIELMLPSHQFVASKEIVVSSSSEKRRIGRPAKWDWEGAVASVTSQIVTSAGAIEGHGRQARVEALLSEWFIRESGDSPATSQIRSRAQRLVEMVEKTEN